jgi:N-acetylmuramoyl-L-alanine amidase
MKKVLFVVNIVLSLSLVLFICYAAVDLSRRDAASATDAEQDGGAEAQAQPLTQSAGSQRNQPRQPPPGGQLKNSQPQATAQAQARTQTQTQPPAHSQAQAQSSQLQSVTSALVQAQAQPQLQGDSRSQAQAQPQGGTQPQPPAQSRSQPQAESLSLSLTLSLSSSLAQPPQALEPAARAEPDAPQKETQGAPREETQDAPRGEAPAVPSAGKPLAGRVIAIDPGHQQKQNSGKEPVAPGSSVTKAKVSSGTAGVSSKTPEYAITLAVGLKLRDLLASAGATVVMTRETNDVDISNAERAKIGNDARADISIRIHADGSENSSVKGISMLAPSAAHVGQTIADASAKAGAAVLGEVIAKTGAKDRGVVSRDDMTGFNWSTVPAILIEMGFMSNADEDSLLNTGAYQDKLAEGMRDGLVKYFMD